MLRLSYRGKTRQKTVTMPSWAFGLVAAGSAALGVALFLAISAIAVLLLPIVLVAGGITAFVMRKRIEAVLRRAGMSQPQPATTRKSTARKSTDRKPSRDEIEDVEYRVVDEPPRRPEEQGRR
jgi:hypothetical protein